MNKKFYSVKEYRLNGVYNFPDYDKVWRLTPGQIAVHSFIRKYVPDFQAFNDKRNPPPARKHDIPEPVEDEDTGVEQHVDAAPMIPLLAADKPASPETRFDAAQMGEYDMRDSATLEEERINAFTTRGDFHVMYDEARRYYVDIVAPLGHRAVESTMRRVPEMVYRSDRGTLFLTRLERVAHDSAHLSVG